MAYVKMTDTHCKHNWIEAAEDGYARCTKCHDEVRWETLLIESSEAHEAKLKIATDALQKISDRIDYVPGPIEDGSYEDDMFEWQSGNFQDDVALGESMGEYHAAVIAREAIEKINK